MAKTRSPYRRTRSPFGSYIGFNAASAPTHAAALVSVGLMDTICPPSTVFGAFNALGSTDKTICEYAFNDHEGGGGFQEREQAAWLVGRV